MAEYRNWLSEARVKYQNLDNVIELCSGINEFEHTKLMCYPKNVIFGLADWMRFPRDVYYGTGEYGAQVYLTVDREDGYSLKTDDSSGTTIARLNFPFRRLKFPHRRKHLRTYSDYSHLKIDDRVLKLEKSIQAKIRLPTPSFETPERIIDDDPIAGGSEPPWED
jgi:hypothetical protein